jgi:hypothetical protein
MSVITACPEKTEARGNTKILPYLPAHHQVSPRISPGPHNSPGLVSPAQPTRCYGGRSTIYHTALTPSLINFPHASHISVYYRSSLDRLPWGDIPTAPVLGVITNVEVKMSRVRK